MATHGCRELFRVGTEAAGIDLLVIDSQVAAEVFKRRFEAIFTQVETLPLAAVDQNPYSRRRSASLESPEGRRCAGPGAFAQSGNGQSTNVSRRSNFAVSGELLLGHQYARSRNISKQVRPEDFDVEAERPIIDIPQIQLHRSAIFPRDRVSPRNPLTWAQPVIPGLMWWRKP